MSIREITYGRPDAKPPVWVVLVWITVFIAFPLTLFLIYMSEGAK